MNKIQIHKVLTKHVQYLQGVYPLDISPSTLIKLLITVINLYKHYMPGSHSVAVVPTGYAEYFHSYDFPQFKHEIMAHLQRHSISWTLNRQTTGCNIECLRALLLLVRPPQIQRPIDDVIRQHICTCLLHLQR